MKHDLTHRERTDGRLVPAWFGIVLAFGGIGAAAGACLLVIMFAIVAPIGRGACERAAGRLDSQVWDWGHTTGCWVEYQGGLVPLKAIRVDLAAATPKEGDRAE